MASPSTEIQTAATNAGFTYEGEEMIGGRNYWRWDVAGASVADVDDFFVELNVNEYIGNNQNGLARTPNSPWCPDGKLRIPETNEPAT